MTDQKRFDVYLHEQNPEISRAQLQRFIKQGKALVNGKPIRDVSYAVKPSDRAELQYDPDLKIDNSKLQLKILYEDKDCIVIDKPIGVLAHSKGACNPEATVATWLAERAPNVSGERAGIVHRLDRATSGVMICAKSEEALKWLQKQFQLQKVKKIYIARVDGLIDPPAARVELPIERNPKSPQRFRVGPNGKPAITTYKTIQVIGNQPVPDSLLELTPETGRTHQLRVHLKHLGHPILGDTFYGGKEAARLYLHAHKLEITLPSKERKLFTSPIPEVFTKEV